MRRGCTQTKRPQGKLLKMIEVTLEKIPNYGDGGNFGDEARWGLQGAVPSID
jgi:hypothetical protein